MAAPVAIVAASIVCAAATWRRLGSLTIDVSHELEVPLRMLEGQRLYIDVHYYWGPLAPVVNSRLFALFGARLEVVMVAGIASAALLAIALYVLARTALSHWEAASVAVAFLPLCAFAQLDSPLFNFVLPHNYSATYGITAATWSAALLVRHLSTGRRAPLYGSVALAWLTALTKIEVVFPVLVVHVAFVALRWRRLGPRVWLAYAAGVLGTLAVYGGLWLRVGPSLLRDNVGMLANDAARHYLLLTMGLDSVREALIDVAASLAFFAVLISVCAVASRVAHRVTPLGAALGAAIPIASAFALIHPQFTLRSLPLLLAIALARSGFELATGRLEADRLARALVVLFGLTVLSRIPFQAGPVSYGYYLLPPALAALAVVARQTLPRFAGGGARAEPVAAAAVLAAMLGLAGAGVLLTSPKVQARSVRVEGPRGTLLVRDAGERRVVAALSHLPATASVLAFPDGGGLSFVSGHTAGKIADVCHNPITIPDPETEARILEDWKRAPPDVFVWSWTVVDARGTFGTEPLGIGHGRSLRVWIEAHYRPMNDVREPFVLLRRVD